MLESIIKREQYGSMDKHGGLSSRFKLCLSTLAYMTDSKLYSDEYFVNQLDLSHILQSHTGCVNALSWSERGDRLISGSDDTDLSIFNTYDDYSLAVKISTGHRANIFSAKFLPQSNSSTIISAAGDSEVRVFDITYSGGTEATMRYPATETTATYRAFTPANSVRHIFRCHTARAKRIVTFPSDPSVFMSCSEDATVRRYDLRESHVCEAGRSGENCPPLLLSYADSEIEFNTITTSPLQPYLYAVAGSSPFIYLHDMRFGRNLQQMWAQACRSDPSVASQCVRRFKPPGVKGGRMGNSITAVKLSEYNSRELLGTWSADNIYLFDIYDSPIDSQLQPPTMSSDTRRKRKRSLRSQGSSSIGIKAIGRSDKSRYLQQANPQEQTSEKSDTETQQESQDVQMADLVQAGGETEDGEALTRGAAVGNQEDLMADEALEEDEKEEEDEEQDNVHEDWVDEDDQDDPFPGPFGDQEEAEDEEEGEDVDVDDIGEDEESEEEDDGSEYRRRNGNAMPCEISVPIVGPRRMYEGHCNVQTVKDVNFYGCQSEYVVSGSDDGNLFIWRKSDGKLINILEGDSEIVNVIEGHPFEPRMAVSGIDNTVKIFTPTELLKRSVPRTQRPPRVRRAREKVAAPEETADEAVERVSPSSSSSVWDQHTSFRRLHLRQQIVGQNAVARRDGLNEGLTSQIVFRELARHLRDRSIIIRGNAAEDEVENECTFM